MFTLAPNLRVAENACPVGRAFIDTPGFSYSYWLQKSHNEKDKIGEVEANVAVIGAGAAGCCAAYELQKSGARVTLFSAPEPHKGGRCYSHFFENADGSISKDIAELGAMRFPPSQEVFFYYLNRFDIYAEEAFPDPGIVPSFISYKGKGQIWQDINTPPAGFENVYKGMHDLLTYGVYDLNGNQIAASAQSLSAKLQHSALDETTLNKVTQEWQTYLYLFQADNFYSGLYKIFGKGRKTYRTRHNVRWDQFDFTKFGTLGIGSGGFAPLYDVSFLYIYRILINELENNQLFIPDGISTLFDRFINEFKKMGGDFQSRKIRHIKCFKNTDKSQSAQNGKITLQFDTGETRDFDYVIVAMTTRAMELGLELTDFVLPKPEQRAAIKPDIAESINRTHVIPASKFFIRTKKFWQDKKYPRTILSDTKLPQLYTLDYGEADSGVVLGQYNWEDDSLKMASFNTAEKYLDLVRAEIAKITHNSDFADFADQLQPYTGDMARDTRLIDWLTQENYYGAFALARSGQDYFIDKMFRDFAKAKEKKHNQDSGVYIAGDCTSWNGGWLEGAFHTGLNAAAAIITSAGGRLTCADNNPMTKVAPARFNYTADEGA